MVKFKKIHVSFFFNYLDLRNMQNSQVYLIIIMQLYFSSHEPFSHEPKAHM